MLVLTIVGLLPIEHLKIGDATVRFEGRALVAGREWYIEHPALGDLRVRRDELRWEDVVSEGGLITTTIGPLPVSELECKETRVLNDDALSVGLEWYLGGERVRRDAWVTMLRGTEAPVVHQQLM